VTPAARTMLLLGASGLVGGHLLRRVSAGASYASVTLLTRRALGLGAGKVKEVVVDFDRAETFGEVAVDDVFCCLGTTIKKAGSQAAFRKVDLEAPLAVARAARQAGARPKNTVVARDRIAVKRSTLVSAPRSRRTES